MQVTVLPFVPPVVLSLLHSPLTRQYDLSSIRRIACGAAPLSRETEVEFKKFIDVGDLRQGEYLIQDLTRKIFFYIVTVSFI
jgi:4-coumarate--CoA ligase